MRYLGMYGPVEYAMLFSFFVATFFLPLISLSRIFSKYGIHGALAFVPFLNLVLLQKLLQRPWYNFILYLIPGINAVYTIFTISTISNALNKKDVGDTSLALSVVILLIIILALVNQSSPTIPIAFLVLLWGLSFSIIGLGKLEHRGTEFMKDREKNHDLNSGVVITDITQVQPEIVINMQDAKNPIDSISITQEANDEIPAAQLSYNQIYTVIRSAVLEVFRSSFSELDLKFKENQITYEDYGTNLRILNEKIDRLINKDLTRIIPLRSLDEQNQKKAIELRQKNDIPQLILWDMYERRIHSVSLVELDDFQDFRDIYIIHFF